MNMHDIHASANIKGVLKIICNLNQKSWCLKIKKFTLCHKLRFYNPYISTTQCCRPKIFQTMNSV